MLADMGADVIRVEKRDGGEDRFVQPVSSTGDGATFLQCNRNKRSMTLDTSRPEGAAIARRLIEADVVVANMPDAAMKANGLDYETLRSIRPDIILACATAYGRGGPYSDRIGFDGIGQVMSGGVYRSGLPEQPIRSVVPYVDFGTAMTLATGTMMALYHRLATGEGQQVEAALLPTAMMMTNGMLIEQALLKQDRGRVGNRGTAVAPCDLFAVSDGWLLVQVASQPMFKRWCRMVGQEGWFVDPRFANDDLRARNADPLNDAMAAWCAARTKAQAVAALEAARIPAGVLELATGRFGRPARRSDRIASAERIYPGTSAPAPVIDTPFRLSATPGTIRANARRCSGAAP
ncbi:CaiB/BaiF CoA transferase family protein [Sphingomonas sp. MMS24-JH45]